ncbi:TRAP transporter small permease subunit [Thalassotalea sp. 1_MG-2023]|uniref:TRAP transporter small permease subunit n=1 Tax=Thalassotalea sp. 1_MG-2023 TaxID=3062680 RepID=UPI0026E3070C|nr:TRAP transporter small permease subunit [Thalassotalea sp. 1_MG-2023]MDO6428641.1 TRAP transporter small permease subunit [Thalassotalea sp. 1_MG-2023]
MSVSKLESFVKHLDTFTEYTGRIISWFTLIMVLLTFTIVVLRYGFNIGWIAMQESVLYFHGFAFMLGAAYTLKHDGHVRVDIFYQKFSSKNKARVNFWGSLLLLLPVCIAIAVVSWDYVSTSWRILEASSEAGGLPLVFLSKSLLLLLALTLSIQGVAEILRSLMQLQNKQEIR